ncbi:MAG: helix-turn-helix transcriptional regulator [Bdellovibrionales bacterium]|nr:helix-turn-helix transcriptional regulator [Bdellovibrionales bacterium]
MERGTCHALKENWLLNRIQELRFERGLTQQDLAEFVDVTRATIIALEKGSYNPSLELAFRLAKFFKVGIEKLFFEKGPPHE